MKYTFTIPGTLPGLNEYTSAQRANLHIGAKLKKQTQQFICIAIRQQLKRLKITKPVIIHYTWIEPNRKRDKDNIAFAKKFIQDSLVISGILRGDGWKEIEGFTDSFSVDKKGPRVVVTLDDREGQAE